MPPYFPPPGTPGVMAPAGLVATDVGDHEVSLSWSEVDNVTNYEVYVDGDLYDDTVGTTMVVTGLADDTEYTFGVRAMASLWSGLSTTTETTEEDTGPIAPYLVGGDDSYADDAVSSISTLTTEDVAAGDTVVVHVSWYNNTPLTSFSGGGLTWTIHGQTPSSERRQSIVTAPAPAGLAAGATLTASFGIAAYARSLHAVAVPNIGAVDDTAFPVEVFDDSWLMDLEPTEDVFIIAFSWVSFATDFVVTPSPGASKLYEHGAPSSPGNRFACVYKESSISPDSIGGSIVGDKNVVFCAAAFKKL